MTSRQTLIEGKRIERVQSDHGMYCIQHVLWLHLRTAVRITRSTPNVA